MPSAGRPKLAMHQTLHEDVVEDHREDGDAHDEARPHHGGGEAPQHAEPDDGQHGEGEVEIVRRRHADHLGVLPEGIQHEIEIENDHRHDDPEDARKDQSADQFRQRIAAPRPRRCASDTSTPTTEKKPISTMHI